MFSSGGYGIAGTGSLIKNGTATLTLNTANSYSGGTQINAGTVVLGTTTALGASTGSLTFTGGTLDLHGNSTTVGDMSGSGAVVTTNTGAATLTEGTANNTNFSGQLNDGSGQLSLTKQGGGHAEPHRYQRLFRRHRDQRGYPGHRRCGRIGRRVLYGHCRR